MKKGDIYRVVSDTDNLVYVGIAMNDSDEHGYFDGMQLSMSVWRKDEDARLSMLSQCTYQLGTTDGIQVALLRPYTVLPSSEDLDVVAAEQKAKEATNG